MSAHVEVDSKATFKLPTTGAWPSLWKVALAVGVVGAIGSGVGYSLDKHHFAFSWLNAFILTMTLAVGPLFFILFQHLTGAAWGVSLRRSAEFLSRGTMILPILFIPVAMFASTLYPWWSHGHGAHGAGHGETHEVAAPDEHATGGEVADAPRGHGLPVDERALHEQHSQIVSGKNWYLNHGFFWARAAISLLAWIAISMLLFRRSVDQDKSGDVSLTKHAQAIAPASTIILALTLTLGALDWVMSLEPAWYSTIFGVYVFAGSIVATFAMVTLFGHALMQSGAVGNAITTEHMHDVGKMLFGFNVFWAYIGFSQFMLIWYAGIPEEATFYHSRWSSTGWQTISLILVFGHFFGPFLFLLSRNVKRRLASLALGAGWLIAMHVLDVYWLVMPNVSPGHFEPHWMDLTTAFACVGFFFAFVFFGMRSHAVIPVRDPRLGRTLRFQNA